MKALFILNDPPYGTERCYNGLRLAGALAKRADQAVRVFLMGDAAACAKRGQVLPKGYYNVETMLRAVIHQGGRVGVCGSCMDARGLTGPDLADDCARSSLEELADWVQWAEQVMTF